jgi:hypothetical protein
MLHHQWCIRGLPPSVRGRCDLALRLPRYLVSPSGGLVWCSMRPTHTALKARDVGALHGEAPRHLHDTEE